MDGVVFLSATRLPVHLLLGPNNPTAPLMLAFPSTLHMTARALLDMNDDIDV